MQNITTFQLATHYLSKIALRIEYLLETIEESATQDHPLMHQCAVKSIIEIIQIIEKPELKSRFLKELMRIEHILLKSHITISPDMHKNLEAHIQILSHVVGIFGADIHIDPFLQSIRPIPLAPMLDYELNAPQLVMWLESSVDSRRHDLKIWLKKLHILGQTVQIYLNILRERAIFDTLEKFNGFYQRILPPKTVCHLILLTVDRSYNIIPRFKLGHYDLSLRFCDADTFREIKETSAKISLALCQI